MTTIQAKIEGQRIKLLNKAAALLRQSSYNVVEFNAIIAKIDKLNTQLREC